MLIPAQNEPLNWKVQINKLFEKHVLIIYPVIVTLTSLFSPIFHSRLSKTRIAKKIYISTKQ